MKQLLVAVLLWVLAWTAQGRTVNVSSDTAFVAALADPTVSVIQLTKDIALVETSANWSPFQPLLRTANVTLRSACAPGCNPEEFKMLDFGFLSGLVLMDNNVTVSFIDMAIAKFRKASGLGMDLFLGRPGSMAFFDNLIGYRLSCSPNPLRTVQMFQNNSLTPSLPGQPSVDLLSMFCWRGTCYPDSVHYIDYATKIAASAPNSESSPSEYGPDSGYFYPKTNVTRVCVSYWPSSCTLTMTADQCNLYYSDKIFTGQQPSQGTNVVVIAVPVALGVAALLGAVVAFMFVQRRRRARRQPVEAPESKLGKDIETGDRNTSDGSSGMGPIGSLINIASGPPLLHNRQTGWQLLASRTNPTVANATAPADDKIELGVLLGAGASGRVYRARWRNQDVAVKVLMHDPHTAALVANETDLMMSFDHPNVVRAYHVVSWRESSGSASNSEPRRSMGAYPPSSLGSHTGAFREATSNNGGAVVVMVDASHEKSSSNDSTPQAGVVTGGNSGPGVVLINSSGGEGRSGANLIGSGSGHLLQITSPTIQDDFLESGDSFSGMGCMAQTWLILEYCDGGALADAVRAGKELGPDGKPDMAKVLSRLHDVADGMRYLHARNVLHRDLKACNILLAADPKAPYGSTAKVADFGLSTAMRPGQTHHSTRTLGTVSHMAPELLRAGKQSPAADVYAFGIVMWELVVGRSAFGNAHYGEVFERVAIGGERPAVEPELKQAVGEEYMLLLEACWQTDPALRPTFEQVCEVLELMLQQYKGGAGKLHNDSAYASGPTGSTGASSRLAALSTSLSRHWNSISPNPTPTQPSGQQPFDGFL